MGIYSCKLKDVFLLANQSVLVFQSLAHVLLSGNLQIVKRLSWQHFFGYKHCAYIRGDTVQSIVQYIDLALLKGGTHEEMM